MTAIPSELAEQLIKYISFQNIHLDKPRVYYADCIMISLKTLDDISNKFGEIKINPNLTHHAGGYIQSTKAMYAGAIFRKRLLLDMHDNDDLYIIKICNINPIILTHIIENNLCVYIPDLPSHYFPIAYQ
jgi:hypothetical protein